MVVANHEDTKVRGPGVDPHTIGIDYCAFQVACNWAMCCRSSHVIKLKLSSQLIGQFGHVTASASCKQPEKHGTVLFRLLATCRSGHVTNQLA